MVRKSPEVSKAAVNKTSPTGGEILNRQTDKALRCLSRSEAGEGGGVRVFQGRKGHGCGKWREEHSGQGETERKHRRERRWMILRERDGSQDVETDNGLRAARLRLPVSLSPYAPAELELCVMAAVGVFLVFAEAARHLKLVVTSTPP